MTLISNFFLTNKIDLQKKFDFPINYSFSNKRKTISIQIYNHSIKVIAPTWTSKSTIQKFILKNEKWITKQIKLKVEEEKIRKTFCHNETFKILDKNYILKIVEGNNNKPKIIDTQSIILVCSNDKNNNSFIKNEIIKIYKAKAEEILFYKTEYFSRLIGEKPKSVKIKDYKSRWGSCSSKKIISYNWRIIMAPIEIVNYLVVHELCHLIHFNHSKSYWHEVEKNLPKYKEYRKWLKLNGHKLTI